MKYKYDRLSKIEKKELFNDYKKNKVELVKKMNRLNILCIIGIIYSICTFIFDFLLKNNRTNLILDIIVFVFCTIALIKLLYSKRELLNKYLIDIEKDKKSKVLEKYSKK